MAENIDINDAYPPKWLTQSNVDALLDKLVHEATFASVSYELIGEPKQRKVVWRFREITQGMVAKKAHHDAAAELYGQATSGWIGKRIQIRRNPKYGTGNGETGLVVLPPRQAPATVQHQDAAEDVPF
jgi:hypothetical protein